MPFFDHIVGEKKAYFREYCIEVTFQPVSHYLDLRHAAEALLRLQVQFLRDCQELGQFIQAELHLLQRVPRTPRRPANAWGAYNAVTRFEDYKQPQQEEMQEQRLERTWFGGGADIKLRALEKAQELSASWN